MCHIICSSESAIPIKCYSPELIVHPVLSTTRDPDEVLEQVMPLLRRMDVLVIGPGLGRDPNILTTMFKLISWAQTRGIPMVLDGDALYLVATQPRLLRSENASSRTSPIILTPNAVGVCCAEIRYHVSIISKTIRFLSH